MESDFYTKIESLGKSSFRIEKYVHFTLTKHRLWHFKGKSMFPGNVKHWKCPNRQQMV